MTITLYISKRTDTDLFAYLFQKKKRSTLIKELLRDYIYHTNLVRLSRVNMTYEQLQESEKKSLSIPIMLTEEERDIIDFLSDCPRGTKSICIKNILRMYINPYVQNVFHTTERELYLPTAVITSSPVAPMPVVERSALLDLLQILTVSQSQAVSSIGKENVTSFTKEKELEKETLVESEEEETLSEFSSQSPSFSREDVKEPSVATEADTAQEDALLDILGVDFG